MLGCFVDATPAIIIPGTILAPLAASVDMQPVHSPVFGVISVPFGPVTPPYDLCLFPKPSSPCRAG